MTLTFLEVVLGIDNIIFMSLVANQLPKEKRGFAMGFGLIAATVIRIGLLFVIPLINKLDSTLITYHEFNLSGKDIILLLGGMFLIYKSTSEIFFASEETSEKTVKEVSTFEWAILQITLINIIFSLDSILTAIGLTTNVTIMAMSIIGSALVMVFFSKFVSEFIEKYKSLKILALSFILMVGLFLILDASHIHVPKAYIYVAIGFSLFVEFINIRFKSRK